jgi:predicted GIY-YIG superfamily endonuclease
MSFYVYMLRCADDSYYIGQTDDLANRFAQHQSGGPRCYTTDRRPVTLVWSQEFSTREEALGAERQVKGWSRRKKEALIAGDWQSIRRLAWGTRNVLPEHLR